MIFGNYSTFPLATCRPLATLPSTGYFAVHWLLCRPLATLPFLGLFYPQRPQKTAKLMSRWCLVSGVWCLVSGVWCLVSRVSCLVSRVSCLVFGFFIDFFIIPHQLASNRSQFLRKLKSCHCRKQTWMDCIEKDR